MDNRKIVWAEGMFLRPQHFQQQEHYLEFYAHARALASESYFWGFRELEIDADALALGKIAINKAVGIFPDGTPFSLPGVDALPEPLEVQPHWKDMYVYLTLPMRRQGTAEVSFAGNAALARYEAVETEIEDCNAVGAEAALAQLAQMRAQLRDQSTLTDSWLHIGVARIVERRIDGTVALDSHYIPPSIAYGQSTPLCSLMDGVAGLMQQRAELLAQRVGQPGRGGIAEVGDFMMLNIINRWQPLMAHLQMQRGLHPERIYEHLLQLAGELSSFTREGRRPIAYPVYQHDNLRDCFEPVILDICRSLSMVLEQNAIPIHFEESQFGIKLGRIQDQSLFRNATFVVAVSAAMPTEAVRNTFPTQVKIGPLEKMRDLVNLNLPGVTVTPMPTAPRQIPYHANFNYFLLDTNSELWAELEQTGGIALHLSGDFPEVKFEGWAIRK